jgi:radial spoke head protein 9
MEFLAPSGSGLSISERAGLDIAMLQVRQSENLPLGSLSFWGRIKGKNDDYLVAVALTPSYPFPSKKFYYTTTAKSEKMSQMPDLSEEYAAHAVTLVSKPFAGEPSMPYPIPPKEGEEEVVAEPVLDENGEEIQPEVFREEHKLAYHVALIDGDATVVPRGAYLVDAAHQVIKNPAYEGLAYEAAGQLRSYFHFRAPKSERAQKALEKPGVVRAGDFLDPIADDVPAGTFSLYYDPSNTMAIIRSFYWPGAYFYHQIGTGNYGSVYMGDGLPNTDIQFML